MYVSECVHSRAFYMERLKHKLALNSRMISWRRLVIGYMQIVWYSQDQEGYKYTNIMGRRRRTTVFLSTGEARKRSIWKWGQRIWETATSPFWSGRAGVCKEAWGAEVLTSRWPEGAVGASGSSLAFWVEWVLLHFCVLNLPKFLQVWEFSQKITPEF